MVQYYIFKFAYIVFLSCSIPLCAQPTTNHIKRVNKRIIPVVRLNDDAQSPLSILWKKYKCSSSPEYKQVITALMTDRMNKDVSSSIDGEICHFFIEEPTAEMALLLGMCNSVRSRDLLEQYTNATNIKLAESCQLGAARRGDKTAEMLFITKYALQLEKCRKEPKPQNVEILMKLQWKLEYIGQAESILAIFNSIGLNEIIAGSGITVVRDTADKMQIFLAQIGVFLPKPLSEKNLAKWWVDNQNYVSKIIRNKKDLPQWKKSRSLITAN